MLAALHAMKPGSAPILAGRRGGAGSGWLAVMPVLALAAGLQAAPLRVLLLSGRNNHDWRATTPKLRQLLEDTGRFAVTVEEHPERLTAERLAGFEVLVSNWNNFGAGDDPAADWPASVREAYTAFVRNGGGHVVVHAGGSSFPDWPAYQAVTLAWWQQGRTRHGPPHEFPVRIEDPDHPVTRGLRGFRVKDELWVMPGVRRSARVLAAGFARGDHPAGSDRWEPLALADRFGRGRCFALLLGHAAGFMDQPGFRALFTRGVEWAATGEVTLPPPPGLQANRPAELAWERTEHSVALIRGNQTLWRYNFGPGESKPSFHPVALPDGPCVTWYRPPDHPWHRGLWFSWKYINRVNYWEEDPATGASAGVTEQEPPAVELRPDHRARIRQKLTYHPAGKEPVLREERLIEVHPPGEDGTLVFDWDLTFAALTHVVLDRTPPPAGGGPGGYAGLSIRMAEALTGRSAVTTETNEVTWRRERFWGRAPGLEYRGRIGEQTLGVAILDHPDNLNAPT
ncbi:MAG: hypothetical protein D6766_06020, partial [Verrucomicrobia bacterium]